MTPVDVSVVIPNKDGAGLVGRATAAALAAGAAEVLVVDDGSFDDSPAEAAHAGARVLRSSGDGFAAAVNTGVSAGSHDPLVLNSDCFPSADALGRLAATLADDASLAACGAALANEDGSPTRTHGHELTLGLALRTVVGVRTPPPRDAGRGVQEVSFLPLACVLIRRSAWDDVGGLDERYRFYFEDQDLCWRLRAAGRRLAVCWEARAVHVGGASSQGRDPQRWFRQYHESRARYLRKRYRRSWPIYALVWVPVALLRAVVWTLRRGGGSRAWALAYARSAFAGLRGGAG